MLANIDTEILNCEADNASICIYTKDGLIEIEVTSLENYKKSIHVKSPKSCMVMHEELAG